MASRQDLKKYSELLELTPLVEAAYPLVPTAATPRWHRKTGKTYFFLFTSLFIVPTLLATIVFGFVFADRYEAETRFVIRSSGRNATNALTNLLQSTGMSRATDDAYAVREFMLSRDAMRDLAAHYGMREAFSRPQADFFWRFPNFYMPGGEEGLYREFRRMVSATYDQTTGVTTLRVQGFEAADSNRLAEGLIRSAEQFVNRLNERSRRDAVMNALGEVKQMERRVAEAQSKLTSYRNRERFVDPAQDSLIVIESIAKLSLDSAETSMQLRQLERAAPGSPQLATLKSRFSAIEAQIGLERARLAGDANSLSSKIAEYERLVLEREFSERALMVALGSVELARVEAQRKQVYLERVATSSKPDYPAYPYRVLLILLVAGLSYIFYKLVTTFALDVRRHGQA